MDDWRIDVLVGGSQKAFMMPPGLAFIALSERAWEKADQAKNSRFYFDLKKEKKNLAKDTTSYTAPVSLIYGLAEALKMMEEESLPKLYARQARTAKAARAGCAALNLKPVTLSPSEAMTGVFLPNEIDGAKFVKVLRDNFGITFAGGQDHWKGKIIRIAQLGYVGDFDIVIAMSAIEMALDKFGVPVKFGSGVGAAQAVLNAGLGGEIVIAAYDATQRAIELLRNGDVQLVLAQKPFDMGYLGVAFAVADHSGVTSLPKLVHTGFAIIDAENVDDPEIARFIYQVD
jgi:aspartate aminotransferase-like enzyme